HRAWWDRVPAEPALRDWFWERIVPEGSDDDACRADVRRVFWERAVPEEWAPVPDVGGWPAARGGYYAQTLWLRAVPENWAPQPGLSLGRGFYAEAKQGYYRHTLWEKAVPEGSAPVAPLPGWPGTSPAGYYAQTFWLRAVPEDWVARPELAIGGRGGRGHYAFWLYHYAAPRDFAWRADLPGKAGPGAGYYDHWLHAGPRAPAHATLVQEAEGHLGDAASGVPAARWFAPDAHAVVILTFDTEGDAAEVCAVTRALRDEDVPATFFVVGRTARGWDDDPAAPRCLAGFDVGSHTDTHPGRRGMSAPGPSAPLLDSQPDRGQQDEITAGDRALRARFPSAPLDSFRTPWCDSFRAFDAGVARNVAGLRRPDGGAAIAADSSVATVAHAALARGVAPAAGYLRSALVDFPYPFLLPAAPGGDRVVELPFAFPSDFAAWALYHLDPVAAAPSRDDRRYAVTVWKDVFDEIHARGGVMVVLMHPFIQAKKGRRPDGLVDLIRYVKSRPGARFSTVHEAAARYRAWAGLSAGAPTTETPPGTVPPR
ncbi:MAG TPA: polysaccharide deacetylase family protein, partial [Candidatus Binatia bacterium]|nr:polysaccharide deacetylase family protein [Candidatus Binatia bacterium]